MLILVYIPASAQSNNYENETQEQEIVCFQNGDYIVIEKFVAPEIGDNINSGGGGNNSESKPPQKICTIKESYYSKDSVLIWQYKLQALYSIDYGIGSVCESTSYTYKIYDDNWTFSEGNASIKNNEAHGIGSFTEKFLFVPTEIRNTKLSIACDKYGNY